jgi:hypothetical protein
LNAEILSQLIFILFKKGYRLYLRIGSEIGLEIDLVFFLTLIGRNIFIKKIPLTYKYINYFNRYPTRLRQICPMSRNSPSFKINKIKISLLLLNTSLYCIINEIFFLNYNSRFTDYGMWLFCNNITIWRCLLIII